MIKKIAESFNKWMAAGKLPKFKTTARIIPLSKSETAFPKRGEIRTISITPAITKVFENIAYKK
jgi:hypothetical protein